MTNIYDYDYEEYGELDLEFEFAKDDVPWRRSGNLFGVTEHKWDNRVDNVGSWRDRLFSDEQMESWKRIDPGLSMFEERAFAELWDYNNNHSCGTSRPIDHILYGREEIAKYINFGNVQACQKVAQIIIQWLGTNIGSCFVNEARQLAKRRQDEWMKKYRPKMHDQNLVREERRKREDLEHRKKLAQLEKDRWELDKLIEDKVNNRLEEIQTAKEEAKKKAIEEARNTQAVRKIDVD